MARGQLLPALRRPRGQLAEQSRRSLQPGATERALRRASGGCRLQSDKAAFRLAAIRPSTPREWENFRTQRSCVVLIVIRGYDRIHARTVRTKALRSGAPT